jgi:phage/plasmid primase-like uncharacterized protein
MNADYRDIECQVVSFMEANGIMPPRDLVLDGKVHRYPVESDRHGARSGAYCIHTDGWPAGWCQDFHIGEPLKWKFKADENACLEWKRRRAELQNLTEERHAQKTEDERQRQEENASKLKIALAVYMAACEIGEAPDHPYLLAKHVQPRGGFLIEGKYRGLRVGDMFSQSGRLMRNLLLIPMMSLETGRFCALHRVFGHPGPDSRFAKGWCTPASGIFPIGIDLSRGLVIACEGIATGLAIYDYFIDEMNEPETTVIATMDAGNFARQATAIRAKYVNRELYAAIDDDDAGRKVALACKAAGFNGIIAPPLDCGEVV